MNVLSSSLLKKDLTYKDICNKIFKDTLYYTDFSAVISEVKVDDVYSNDLCNKNCETSVTQLRKMLAVNQLMNIAKYYNGDWEPNWSNTSSCKYIIYYNKSDNEYLIDNQNFREILDIIFK